MFGVGNPIFAHYVDVFDSDLGCLVLETQHLRIMFEVLDPDLGCLVLETHFPRTCFKNIDFYTVWEPAWYTEADQHNQHNQADQADQAEMVHGRQLGP